MSFKGIPCRSNQIQLCGSIVCLICLARSFALHIKSGFWSISNVLKPWGVTIGTAKKYNFDCDKCNHTFESTPSSMITRKFCSYCQPIGGKLCDNMDCQSCFKRSFASSHRAQYWSLKNEISPRKVFRNCQKKFLFNCDKCPHEFKTDPGHITNGNTFCPFCTGQKLCENLVCVICLNKTLAFHPKMDCWSKENISLPHQVFKHANSSKHYLDCDNCGHEFRSFPSEISAGNWCPHCCIPTRLLCEDVECKQCFSRSFASTPRSKNWSVKNVGLPRDYFKHSSARGFFDCDVCGNGFDSILDNVTRGYWCRFCKNKTEALVASFLSTIDGLIFISQGKFEWCRNSLTNNYFPFDFCLRNYNIILEIDGQQHFDDIKHWDSSSDKVSSRDVYKMKVALDNGYSMVRMVQEEIWDNKIVWKDHILNILNMKLMEPEIIYVSNNVEIYNNHKFKLKELDINKIQIIDEESMNNNTNLAIPLQNNISSNSQTKLLPHPTDSNKKILRITKK